MQGVGVALQGFLNAPLPLPSLWARLHLHLSLSAPATIAPTPPPSLITSSCLAPAILTHSPPRAGHTWLSQVGPHKAHPPLYPSQPESAPASCSLEKSLQKSPPTQHYLLLLLTCRAGRPEGIALRASESDSILTQPPWTLRSPCHLSELSGEEQPPRPHQDAVKSTWRVGEVLSWPAQVGVCRGHIGYGQSPRGLGSDSGTPVLQSPFLPGTEPSSWEANRKVCLQPPH